MLYAHESQVLKHLEVDESDTETVNELADIERGLVTQFNHKIGRTFMPVGGDAPLPMSRVVFGDRSDILILSDGIVSVQGVEADGEVIPADEYSLIMTTDTGSYGLLSTRSHWFGPVTVTGIWADQPYEPVPADVRSVLTDLTIKAYRRRTASPTDQVGPDGMIVSTPDGWRDEAVKNAIADYGHTRILV